MRINLIFVFTLTTMEGHHFGFLKIYFATRQLTENDMNIQY